MKALEHKQSNLSLFHKNQTCKAEQYYPMCILKSIKHMLFMELTYRFMLNKRKHALDKMHEKLPHSEVTAESIPHARFLHSITKGVIATEIRRKQ